MVTIIVKGIKARPPEGLKGCLRMVWEQCWFNPLVFVKKTCYVPRPVLSRGIVPTLAGSLVGIMVKKNRNVLKSVA